MNLVHFLVTRFYRLLIWFYPLRFRLAFADEMAAVFSASVEEAGRNGPAAMMALCLKELAAFPFNLAREYWSELTAKAVPMTTIQRKPGGLFYLAWVLLSVLCIPLAFGVYWAIIKLVVSWVGVRMQVGDLNVITEDYLLQFIFVPSIGLLTGLLQFLLLRRYLPKVGWWILATGLGSLLTALFMIFRYPLSLRVDLDYESKLLMTTIFIVIGGITGLAQWLVLRRRLLGAAWWIPASAIGWGIMGLVGRDFVLLATGLGPAVATGLVLWFLLNRLPSVGKGGLAA